MIRTANPRTVGALAGPTVALVAALVLLAAVPTSAVAASSQTFTLIDQAGVKQSTVRSYEAAVTNQSYQLRAYWGTPIVRWGPGGWPVYLQVYTAQEALDNNGQPIAGVTDAYHLPVAGLPTIYVPTDGSAQGWSVDLSHEVIETLVDPYPSSTGHEACDPVAGNEYGIGGVFVSDFATPRYFGMTNSGRFDFMRILRSATPGSLY